MTTIPELGSSKRPKENSSRFARQSFEKLIDDVRQFLPRCDLGIYPTPLQHLATIGELIGHRHFYVKRDDLSGLGLGGNKVRSLRFLLGDALSRKSDVVITSGGLQSNLCTLTAAACNKMGLRCILVHNDNSPVIPTGNQFLNRLLGAEQRFLGKVDETTRTIYAEGVSQEEKEKGHNPYVIENGGSTPLGCLGYMEAAIELGMQAQDMSLDLKHVVIVGAMGGTASGFILGNMLLGNPFFVHVISVEYDRSTLEAIINRLVQETLSLLEARHFPAANSRGPVHLDTPQDGPSFVVYDQYLGEGYGVPTEDSRKAALLLARSEGIFLETVYNSKTFAGALDLIGQRIIGNDEAVCVFHTGGLGALFGETSINPFIVNSARYSNT